MKLTIKGKPKKIAALVLAVQERRDERTPDIPQPCITVNLMKEKSNMDSGGGISVDAVTENLLNLLSYTTTHDTA